MFEATGIHDTGTQLANGAALSIPDTIMRRSHVSHREGIEAAMVCAQRSWRASRRCSFFCMRSAPGGTQRAIRRACRGRELASPDHRAKYLQLAALGLGGVALLIWPGPVRWERSGLPQRFHCW